MLNENELKPCPFCGGNAKISWKDIAFAGQNDFGFKRRKFRCRVTCNKCHAHGSPVTTDWIDGMRPIYDKPPFTEYAKGAIELWNERKEA